MGLAISVGTGIAQAIKGTSVTRAVVIEGDGSLLMNPGSAITAGYLAPENLVIVLLDNGVYASTACIPTHAENSTSAASPNPLTSKSSEPATPTELNDALKHTLTEAGPGSSTPEPNPATNPAPSSSSSTPSSTATASKTGSPHNSPSQSSQQSITCRARAGPASAHLLKARELQWK